MVIGRIRQLNNDPLNENRILIELLWPDGSKSEKKIITIQTPGNDQLEISDEGRSIKLSDQNGNLVILDPNRIALFSDKDIVLKLGGNVIIDASSNINFVSNADIVLNGLNIQATAQVGLTGKGNATAELTASGTTTQTS